MYSIEITDTVKKFLKKIPKSEVEILLKKIYSIRDNPFRFLKKLKGSKLWRLRVLKYRVLVDVIVSGKKIIVVRIGHRKGVY